MPERRSNMLSIEFSVRAGPLSIEQDLCAPGLHAESQREAQQTKNLVNAQRDEVLRKQRERAGSFQPQLAATPAR